MSNKERVLDALVVHSDGLTAAQIQARYGVGNARAEISRLRMDGYAVYANRRTDTKGRTKTFYRLGRPSRKVVAAGYRALARGLVTVD